MMGVFLWTVDGAVLGVGVSPEDARNVGLFVLQGSTNIVVEAVPSARALFDVEGAAKRAITIEFAPVSVYPTTDPAALARIDPVRMLMAALGDPRVPPMDAPAVPPRVAPTPSAQPMPIPVVMMTPEEAARTVAHLHRDTGAVQPMTGVAPSAPNQSVAQNATQPVGTVAGMPVFAVPAGVVQGPIIDVTPSAVVHRDTTPANGTDTRDPLGAEPVEQGALP